MSLALLLGLFASTTLRLQQASGTVADKARRKSNNDQNIMTLVEAMVRFYKEKLIEAAAQERINKVKNATSTSV